MLIAARWTVLLSLVAITGGGLLGLRVMLAAAVAPPRAAARGAGLHPVLRGDAAADAAIPGVLRRHRCSACRFDAWTAAVIAFSLHASAFLGDIWQGSVLAVPLTQWEAARSLALPLVGHAAPGRAAAGGADRGGADDRLSGSAHQIAPRSPRSSASSNSCAPGSSSTTPPCSRYRCTVLWLACSSFCAGRSRGWPSDLKPG